MQKIIFSSMVAALMLSGCANTRYASYSTQRNEVSHLHYGYITELNNSYRKDSTATGAILGGTAGYIVGKQFGNGSGKGAMSVLGAIGGAMAGSAIQDSNQAAIPVQQMTIKLDNSQYLEVQQDQPPTPFRLNQRVKVRIYGDRAQVDHVWN